MNSIKAKKFLGQHFLKDESIAKKIVDSISFPCDFLIELGAGTGALTKYLVEKQNINNFLAFDVDPESIEYLKKNYPTFSSNFILNNYLTVDLTNYNVNKFSLIGNLPYNISSQIFFKLIEQRNQVNEVVCMIQKEVAQRIASPPCNKTYGILSVFLQAWFSIEYLFTVNEDVFIPPPKVKSGVIRLKRNSKIDLNCDEQSFVKLVKTAFNQRRKTLKNALKYFEFSNNEKINSLLLRRAETLSVSDFIYLTQQIVKK